VGNSDIELAVADTVALRAEDVDGAAVLPDLGADERVAEGHDVGDFGDVGGGGAGETL
jgi:hypothetical protein